MPKNELAGRIQALSAQDSDRLLQAVFDRLLAQVGTLEIDDEEAARELLASFLTQPTRQVSAVEVARPSIPADVYVRHTLDMLVGDAQTAPIVAEELDQLPPESQMFADPVTAALVLGVLIAFLQTKFDVAVSRKDGKLDFSFSASKAAASDEVIAQVVAEVGGVVIR